MPGSNTFQPLYIWTKTRQKMRSLVLAQNRGWCDSLGLFLCPLGRKQPRIWLVWTCIYAVCGLWGCSEKKLNERFLRLVAFQPLREQFGSLLLLRLLITK